MACAFLGKNSKVASERGQGTVEYLLVLVVTIILILGLMTQFYKPFNKWMTSYMGPYLQCLLDVGELPTFGSTGDSGLCAAEFQAGSGIYSKTPPIADTHSPTSSSGGSENNSKSATSNSSGRSSGGGGSSGSDAYRVKGFPIGKSRGADAPTEAMSGGEVPLSQTRYFNAGGSAGELAPVGASAVGVTGLLPAEKEQLKKREEKIFNAGRLSEFGSSAKNKKLELKEPERKIANETPETPWGFSSYLKFAVILMIIIAIVLFLGGQVLQISKSMEK